MNVKTLHYADKNEIIGLPACMYAQLPTACIKSEDNWAAAHYFNTNEQVEYAKSKLIFDNIMLCMLMQNFKATAQKMAVSTKEDNTSIHIYTFMFKLLYYPN